MGGSQSNLPNPEDLRVRIGPTGNIVKFYRDGKIYVYFDPGQRIWPNNVTSKYKTILKNAKPTNNKPFKFGGIDYDGEANYDDDANNSDEQKICKFVISWLNLTDMLNVAIIDKEKVYRIYTDRLRPRHLTFFEKTDFVYWNVFNVTKCVIRINVGDKLYELYSRPCICYSEKNKCFMDFGTMELIEPILVEDYKYKLLSDLSANINCGGSKQFEEITYYSLGGRIFSILTADLNSSNNLLICKKNSNTIENYIEHLGYNNMFEHYGFEWVKLPKLPIKFNNPQIEPTGLILFRRGLYVQCFDGGFTSGYEYDEHNGKHTKAAYRD